MCMRYAAYQGLQQLARANQHDDWEDAQLEEGQTL
jgi:hypothetical protein